jgi:hypothetical protein
MAQMIFRQDPKDGGGGLCFVSDPIATVLNDSAALSSQTVEGPDFPVCSRNSLRDVFRSAGEARSLFDWWWSTFW